MNDTFLSIENATGVAGWEIRAGLCRFPPTGRGARLTSNLWCIKKMTDASGDVCSLSPEVSVYSCLWMICPWWLFWSRYRVYLITDEKLPFPHCKPCQDASQSVKQSSTLHSQQMDVDEIYYCSLLSVCQMELLFQNRLWLLTCRCIYIVLMKRIHVSGSNVELVLSNVKLLLFFFCTKCWRQRSQKWMLRWRNYVEYFYSLLLNRVDLKCLSSQCTYHSYILCYVTAQTSGRK